MAGSKDFLFWIEAIKEEKYEKLDNAIKEGISINLDLDNRYQIDRKIYIPANIQKLRWVDWLSEYPYVSLMEDKKNKKEENLANITSGNTRTYEEILTRLISGKIIKYDEREKTFILEFDIFEDLESLSLNRFILLNFSEFPYVLYEQCVNYIRYNNVIEISRSLLLFGEQELEKKITNDESPIHLYQGPPGTGKTFDLISKCKKIYQSNKNKKSKVRVLITGFTHTSVRNIIEGFIDECITSFTTVNIHGLRQDINLKYDLKEKIKRVPEGSYMECKNKILKESLFTFITCLGAKVHLSDFKYNLIIIDEVGQVYLPLVSFIISLLNKNVENSALLYGDPNQLPPVVIKGKLSNNRKNPLNITIYEKLKIDYFLDTQYRGRPEIFWLISALFYSGKINTSLEKNHKPFFDLPALIYYTYDDAEDINRRNNRELGFCLRFVKKEIGERIEECPTEMPKLKVSVISPFRVQAKILNNFISSKVVDLLNGTVHVMQGQTRDIVIGSISATNSSIFLTPPKKWIMDLAENTEEIFNLLNNDAKKCKHIYKFEFRPVLNEIKLKWDNALKEYKQRNFLYNEKELKLSTYAGYEYKGESKNRKLYRSNIFAPNIFNVLFSRARCCLVLFSHDAIASENIILTLTKIWIDTYNKFRHREEIYY